MNDKTEPVKLNDQKSECNEKFVSEIKWDEHITAMKQEQNVAANQSSLGLPEIEIFQAAGGDDGFTSADLKPIFDKHLSGWDTNNDGKLQKLEIQNAIESGTTAGNDAQQGLSMMEEFYQGLDKQGDGIDDGDMQGYQKAQENFSKHLVKMKATVQVVRENFDYIDGNSDGQLTADEISSAAASDSFSIDEQKALTEMAQPQTFALAKVLDSHAGGDVISEDDLTELPYMLAAMAQYQDKMSPVPAGIDMMVGG